MFDLTKDTQNGSSTEKMQQVVVARNELSNLQRTLSKEAIEASLAIFVTDCFQIFFKNGKCVLKTQGFI